MADQILETYSASLTSYLPTGKTKVQNLRPRPEERGVDLDGSLRSAPGIPAPLAGNPFENVWGGTAAINGVRLDTGSYNPFEVDLSLPAPGHSWVISRSYSSRQDDGGHFNSDGYQGKNWAQNSQPELKLFTGATADLDVLYLVYGADRYVEFQRDGVSSNDFKGKNGAAGAFTYASGSPDLYTLTCQNGTAVTFFGGNTASNKADWQLWKIVDAAGNTSYVGDATTASTAVTNGFDASGRITKAYDTADRRYTYTYSSHDSVTRLDSVKAETKSGGTWSSPTGLVTVGLVAYGYYTSETYGEPGDLKTVTRTTTTSQSDVDHVMTKYYRYYEDGFDAGTHPGYDHQIMLVLDYEGARNFDWTHGTPDDETFDDDYLTASTNDLKPFSSVYLEYDSNRQVNLAAFNGDCGCGGGGVDGTTLFTYGTSGYTNTGGYDTAWARRAIVVRSDGTYLTQYFDEVGQPLSQVITNTNPASSPTQTWVTGVVRDSMGCVTEIDTPASVSGYTHSTGAITLASSAGLIRTYTRASSTDVKGFVTDVKFKTGSSGTAYLEHSWTHDYTTATKALTDVTIARPLIASDRVYSTAVTSGTSGSYLTSYTYTAYGSPDTLSIEKIVTTHPVVSTGTNGSNSADTTSVHLREDGLQDYAKSEGGEITYTAYTNGQVTERIQDADTGTLSEPTGFTSTGSPQDLSTTMTYDAQGRMRSRTLPTSRREQWTHATLTDRRYVTLHYPHSTAGGDLYGPASVETRNLAGKPIERATVVISGGVASAYDPDDEVNEGVADSIAATDVGTLTQAALLSYDSAGSHSLGQNFYTVMPGSFPGLGFTNYDASSMTRDDMGRTIRTVDRTGTIHRKTYDALGRAYRTWIGTNDYGEFGGSGSGPNNMVKVEELEFDGNAAGGNSYLTKRTLFVEDSTTDQRVTNYTNDVRGNVLLVDNPTGPDQLTKYDNMNRSIAVGAFSSTSASNDPTSTTTNRLALSETAYDERGRVWKTIRHKIDVSDGSDDDTLESLTWYDAEGQVIKQDGEQLMKTQYDSAGRVVAHYTIASDNDSAYTDADDVTGDIVLEQHQTAYDGGGRVTVQASISRYHTDLATPTGSLDTAMGTPTAFTLTGGSPDVLGRIQISAQWFDALDRVTGRAEYGAHPGANFTYAGSVPSRSDTVLVTTSTFNHDGTLLEVTDPKGLVTRYEYNAEGMRTKVISNFVDGTPSTATADDDQIVEYAYSLGRQTSITAYVDGSSNDQVTTYSYGVVKGTDPDDSKISSGQLLLKVTYPDSTGAADSVKFAYNAQGQQIWKEDQRITTPSAAGGNVYEMTYDTAGRETARAVTTLASGYDGAVMLMETAYTALGQVETVTQLDAVTSGAVVDQVKYLYDGWGNVTGFRQDIDSTVGGSGYYEAAYTYAKATGGRNTLRRTDQTIGGKTFTLDYSSSGSSNDANASRVTSIKDGATVLVKYDYVGAGQVVGTMYDEPDVMSKQYTATVGDYADLDRFNRVTTSKWTKDLATDTDFYNVALTYDRNSNITKADDADATSNGHGHVGFDIAYTMDNLNRLTVADEGTLSGGSITSRTRKQQWVLTQTGNWSEDKLDLNGDADWGDADEWQDDKTFNKVNEILTRDLDGTPGTTGDNYSLAYDLAGNIVDDGTDYDYEWDAFYRLRKVKTQAGATVAEYRYNGLGYRIGVHEDTDSDTDVDGSDLWYYHAYDERWRMVATYRSTDTDPKERFVHHQAGGRGYGSSSYIDLVAFREKDANTAWTTGSDGTLEERFYYCQNQHADVVALVTAAGGQREMDRYSAYGVPFGLPVGDCNSDGDADSSDRGQINTWIGTNYDVRGDLDLDGDVDATDRTTLRDNFEGITLGRFALSADQVSSAYGYAGYELDRWNAYNIRHRYYAAASGVWWGRDKAGYESIPSLYIYSRNAPHIRVDASGLASGVCTATLEAENPATSCWGKSWIIATHNNNLVTSDGECIPWWFDEDCTVEGTVRVKIMLWDGTQWRGVNQETEPDLRKRWHPTKDQPQWSVIPTGAEKPEDGESEDDVDVDLEAGCGGDDFVALTLAVSDCVVTAKLKLTCSACGAGGPGPNGGAGGKGNGPWPAPPAPPIPAPKDPIPPGSVTPAPTPGTPGPGRPNTGGTGGSGSPPPPRAFSPRPHSH